MMIFTSVKSEADDMKKIEKVKTYMSYTWPLDPARIVTLAEMDLSYALAGTLTEWNSSKQLTAGLVSRWEMTPSNTARLYLAKDLKWSDGTSLTSMDVKRTFDRGLKFHPQDFLSFNKLIANISCPDEGTLDFKLRDNATLEELLEKLTEPNFGILNIKANESIDLTKSSGPYALSTGSVDQLDLKANPQSKTYSKRMADEIVVRPIPQGTDLQKILLEEGAWPNLVQISSLMPEDTLRKYQEKKFENWRRPTDRAFLFQLSPRNYSQDGLNLFKFLQGHLNKGKITEGLSGYNSTEQFFPKGYALHDGQFKIEDFSENKIPARFKDRPLEILLSPERVCQSLIENIKNSIREVTGHEPRILTINMAEYPTRFLSGNFDFYAGTVGIADPSPEGLMSFYFENEVKIIPPVQSNFIKRLDDARKLPMEKRLAIMRTLLSEAVNGGYAIPFFHLSTVGWARKGIDLSQIPPTDESVTLSKIRLK